MSADRHVRCSAVDGVPLNSSSTLSASAYGCGLRADYMVTAVLMQYSAASVSVDPPHASTHVCAAHSPVGLEIRLAAAPWDAWLIQYRRPMSEEERNLLLAGEVMRS